MTQTRIVDKDRWIIGVGSLLLGYFFVNLGQTDSLFELWKQPFYFRDILISALITAIVWIGVRTATRFLDRRYDWLEQPIQRITGQFFIGFLLPVFVSLVLVLLFFEFIIQQDITDSTFPIYEFPISLLVIALMNFYYFGWYLYDKATNSDQKEAVIQPVSKPAPIRKILMVSSGMRNIPLSTAEVAYVFIEDTSVYVTLFSGERYLINSSLDDLAQDLPGDSFFRANRQFLLHRKACKSFLNETYGKLKVEVQPTVSRDIIISQQKAPDFKKWLEEQP